MSAEEVIAWYQVGLFSSLGLAVTALPLVMLARWAKQIFSA